MHPMPTHLADLVCSGLAEPQPFARSHEFLGKPVP